MRALSYVADTVRHWLARKLVKHYAREYWKPCRDTGSSGRWN